MKTSDRPSTLSGRKTHTVVIRRLGILAASKQTLDKLTSELRDLELLGVKVTVRAREHLGRLDADILGPPTEVARAVEAAKGRLGAQIMRDGVLAPLGPEPDPPYPDLESGHRIAVPESAGTLGHGPVRVPGEPVIVAIVDSGIMAAHPKLRAHLWSGLGFSVVGRKIKDRDIEDADGHGTMLAGTVLAGARLSPDVRLMAAKFFDGRTIPESGRAALAIHQAVQQGAHILNLSWAVGIDKQRAIHDAIANASRVLFVVAAGNSGADNDKYPTVPADYGRDLSNVITVMATDDFDDKPGFSNYGDTTVHIAAPGMRVISTHSYLSAAAQPGNLVSYQRYDGTSPAAAYVAGAAALLKSQDPKLSPEDIRKILIKTADQRSDLRCVAKGRLNVSQALALVQARLAGASPPVPSGNRRGYSRPPALLLREPGECEVPGQQDPALGVA